jgi:hypothetical protein
MIDVPRGKVRSGVGLGMLCSMKTMLMMIVLLVGACSFKTFDEQLPKFVGQPIESLVEQLGLPNAEQTIMGRKVYTWRSDMSYTSITPVSTTNTGYAGNRMAPVTLTSTSYVPSTSNLACSIRAVVSATNSMIESIDYEGNNGACLAYSSRLKPPSVSAPTSPPTNDYRLIMCRLPASSALFQLSASACTGVGGTVV